MVIPIAKKRFFLDDMMGGIMVSLQVLYISKVVGHYHSGLEHTLTWIFEAENTQLLEEFCIASPLASFHHF
jgi:hypothetical protein